MLMNGSWRTTCAQDPRFNMIGTGSAFGLQSMTSAIVAKQKELGLTDAELDKLTIDVSFTTERRTPVEHDEASYEAGYNDATKRANETWRALIKSVAETSRLWSVSMGGNTPLALIATMLGELVEPSSPTERA